MSHHKGHLPLTPLKRQIVHSFVLTLKNVYHFPDPIPEDDQADINDERSCDYIIGLLWITDVCNSSSSGGTQSQTESYFYKLAVLCKLCKFGMESKTKLHQKPTCNFCADTFILDWWTRLPHK